MFLGLSRIGRYWLTVAGVAIAYFLTAKFAFSLVQLGSRADASVLYPPAGIALASVLRFGRKTWVGVALGVMLFARSLSGVSWLTAIGATFGSVAEVLVASVLLEKLEFDFTLRRIRDVMALIGVLYLAASVNATISTFNGIFAGLVDGSEFLKHWLLVWLGDAVSMIVITPALLVWSNTTWFTNWQQKTRFRRKVAEVLLWLTLLFICSAIALEYPLNSLQHELRDVARSLLNYLPFLFVVWAALRLGQRGTVLSLLMVFMVAVWGVAQDHRNFEQTSRAQIQQVLFQLQTFMSVMSAIALVLAAAISERGKSEAMLRTQIQQDKLLAESTLRIRQSLDLKEVLNTTVAEVREFLDADRVYISIFDQQGYTEVVAESVTSKWKAMLGTRSPRPILPDLQAVFANQSIGVNHNSANVRDNEFLKIYYQIYEIKASIGVALFQEGNFFGVLNVNQCGAPRTWQASEIRLLEQLATQVELSIQQGRLYQQVQDAANNLEQQVQERTQQLIDNMEELRSANALKDMLLHAVSHDLRTPIIGTQMVLQRLQSKAGDSVAISKSILDRMVESSDRQLHLIQSLLEDAAAESKPLVLRYQTIDFAELVQTTVRDMEPILKQNHTIVENSVPKHLTKISTDPIHLRRVLENLITNAVEHNLPGVTLKISAEESELGLRCAIADNGVGMAEAQSSQLFTRPFLRGTQNHHRTGLGLGLFLCAQIVNAHHGKIGVESAPNQGTEFWFTLPI
jgi:signal transduction histidine kinase/integral membrane sensor domain MASE1